MIHYFRLRKQTEHLQPVNRRNILSLANAITLFRLFLLIPAGMFLWNRMFTSVVILLTIFVILDMVDGHLARLQNKATAVGRYFDKTTDKLGWFVVLIIIWLQNMAPKSILLLVFTAHVAHPIFSWIYLKKYKKLPQTRIQWIVALSAALLIFFPQLKKILYTIIVVTTLYYIVYLIKITWTNPKKLSSGHKMREMH